MAEAVLPSSLPLHHRQVAVAPIIRQVPLGNVLTSEQEQWLRSKAFDFKTENPLVYKQISNKEDSSSENVEERRQAVVEVQSLQDSMGVGGDSSDVVVKLKRQRKERHDKAWTDMKAELAAVSLEVEGRIDEVAHLLKNRIKEKDRVISTALEESHSKLPLHLLVRQDLVELWEDTLCLQLEERATLIQDTSGQLERIEQDRVSMVEGILGQWSQVLRSISFLLPEDLNSLVHREAQAINGAVVANKLSNAELILTLLTGNADKSRAVRRQWEELVGVWQEACCNYVADCFRRFIDEQSVKWRAEMDHLKECWTSELKALGSRRLQHLEQLKSHVPPRVSKPQCHEWQQGHSRLAREVSQVQSGHLARLQALHERVSSISLEEGDRWKEELVCSGACDRETAHQFALDHLVPLVEHKQKELGRELRVYEEYCGSVLEVQTSKALELFQFVLGAAHLWDMHLSDLEEEEQKMAEGLKQCRRSHDLDNQKVETELDLLLDQLRQGTNEEVLKALLQESLTRLDHVKDGYHTFQQRMLSALTDYPMAVSSAVGIYDLKLCKYFQVQRKPPKRQKKTSQSRRMSQATSRAGTRESQLSDLTHALEETVATSTGTVFYISKQSTLGSGDSPGVFLTQTAGAGPAPAAAFLAEAMDIPEDTWDSVGKSVRCEFLEQLEQWKLSSVNKAERTVAEKSEELSVELDLRLHLHEGRPARVEQDIHHIRATELLAHRERVSRHIQSVRGELTTLKGLVEELEGKHKTLLETLGSELNDQQKAMEIAHRMSGLLSVQELSKTVYHKHLSDGEACAAEVCERVEESCASLSQSTKQFRESLRSFSEGGNYSPEEAETYRQKMDRLTSRIALTQTTALKDLQALKESYVEAAGKLLAQFEYKWSQYRMDLTLVEKITHVLQNTQIRIKSEVAASNTQCRTIKELILQLPNKVASSADKTEVACVSLKEVFQAVKGRVEYLHCSVQHHGARVGTVEEELVAPLSSITATQVILDCASSTTQGRNQHPRTTLPTATSTKPATAEAASRKLKQTERKHVTYGFGGGKDGSECFLPKIRQVLKEAHIELYTSAEGYYRQKGARCVTQSELLEGTFDGCMDKIITRLQSYRRQAEEYRNDCIDELHDLLHLLGEAVKDIPEMCLGRIFADSEAQCNTARDSLQQQHAEKMEAFRKEHVSNMSQLRPALGHPSKESELAALDCQERERHKQALQLLTAHTAAEQEVEKVHARHFTEKLLLSVTGLVGVLDEVTLHTDIIPPCGSKSRVKSDLEQLLRSRTSGNGDGHEREPAKPGSRAGQKWPGLRTLELACGDKALATKMKASLSSKKQSLFHEKVFESRDGLCKDYLSHLRSREDTAKERGEAAKGQEESKLKKWQSSLDNVKKLYVV